MNAFPIVLVISVMFNQTFAGAKGEVDSEVTCPSFQATTGRPHIALGLPEPIGQQELSRYKEILRLSEAQYEAAASFHVEYCVSCQQLFEYVQSLWKRSERIKPTEAPDDFDRLLKDRDRFITSLRSIEGTFFDSITGILADEQMQFVQHVRSDRMRQQCAIAFSSVIYPDARWDLVALLDSQGLDTDQMHSLLPLMMEYSAVVAPKLCELADQWSTLASKSNALMAQLDQLSNPEQRERVGTALLEQRQDLFKPSIRRSKVIAEINRTFVDRFVEMLPDEHGSRFRQQFLKSSYPQVYPDSASAEPLVEAVLRIPSLSDEQQAAITFIADEYVAKYARICQQMEDRVNRWAELTLTGGQFSAEDKRQYESDLGGLKLGRVELYRRLLTDFKNLLTPEQFASLPLVPVHEIKKGR